MRRSKIGLKHWVIALTLWLLFIFNIERVIRPVDITKYTYACVALVVVIVLLVPRSYKISLWLLTGVPVLLLIFAQILTGDPVWGQEFPITITEVSSVVLTGILAKQMVHHLAEFEDIISRITINYVGTTVASFEKEQGIMYKELKRARLYERPLSVIKIKITSASFKRQLPQILKAYRASLINQMSIAGVAEVLDNDLFDTDIIAQDKDSLIVMFPELDGMHTQKVIKRIQELVMQKTGYQLELGAASYPEDAITFEALLEAASENAALRLADASDNVVKPVTRPEKISQLPTP